MSVENKIQELLGKKGQLTEAEAGDLMLNMQGSSEKATFDTTPGIARGGKMASAKASKDTSKAATVSVSGDASMPRQGSSQDASFAEMDEDEPNLGAKSSAAVSRDTTLPMKGKGDAKTARVPAMEETESEEETITEVDVRSELSSIFGEDISEEFKTKATSIFEAAVIARVNHEMERITDKLEEQNSAQLQEYKETLVEKVDSYLNYVVEQWMEENQVAVENGLRSEITEEFIAGLKNLFKENYIEVPEEKYDVIDDLTGKVDTLSAELDESIQDNIELAKQLVELKKEKIFEEETSDLASTEVEKLRKLIENVEFDSEEIFAEKVSVIKENYFPKGTKKSAEQTLVEEASHKQPEFESNDVMSKYVESLSRTIKSNK